MNTNSMCCADAKNCSCEMCNECCDNVNVSGCGNPMYNVFSWNSSRKCCYRPELCAIDILHYYLTKGEAAELYVNNREFLDFLKEVKNIYETKEHVFEILQDLYDKIDSVAESYEWDDIKNKPSFATVATSGDYSDLNNKPKFKTINSESILGDGNIEVTANVDDHLDETSENPVQNKAITAEVGTIKGGSNKSIAALDAQDVTLEQRIGSLETAVGTDGSVDVRIQMAVSEEATTRQAKDEQLLTLYEALTQSDIVVVADHTEVSSPETNTIYREYGDTSYSDLMYYDGNWYKMATYNNAIDDTPTAGSNNLVKSGGIVAKYGEYKESVAWVRVLCDKEGRLLFGIREDGSVDWSRGVPAPVIQFVYNCLEEILKDTGALKEFLTVKEVSGYSYAVVDSRGRIVFGTRDDGEFVFGKMPPVIVEALSNKMEGRQGFDDVYIRIVKDDKGRIIQAVSADGTSYFPKLESPTINELRRRIPADYPLFKEKVNALEEAVEGGGDYLPDYYVDYMKAKIYAINKIGFEKEAIGSDTFCFVTDTHTLSNAMWSPSLIREILKNTNCDKLIWGGDSVRAYTASSSDSSEKSKDYIYEDWEKQRQFEDAAKPYGKVFNVRGNHDFTIRKRGSDQSEKYDLGWTYPHSTCWNEIIKKSLTGENISYNASDDGSYYTYVEHKSKTKYFFCDGQSKEAQTGNYAWGYDTAIGISDTQLAWLRQEFLSTPEGYNVFVVNHEGIVYETYFHHNGYLECANLLAEVEALAGRTGVYANKNVGHIVVLCGHEHADTQTYRNGILHVATACDALYSDQNDGMYFTPISRAENDVTEQLFDVVMTDFGNDMIRMERIGCGYNRSFHLNPISLNVGSSQSLSCELTPASWHSYNSSGNSFSNHAWTYVNTVVSVNNGVVTGVSAGEAVVMAMDANGNKEFFNIKING